jgi:hypothetical protein
MIHNILHDDLWCKLGLETSACNIQINGYVTTPLSMSALFGLGDCNHVVGRFS